MRRRDFGLCLVFALLAVMPVCANESALAVRGGALQLLGEHRDVRMVSAHISADVWTKGTHVRCEYALHNEGPAQTVTLGFPDTPDEPASERSPYHLQQFQSWADGKPLTVRLRATRRTESAGPERWFVRDLWFARGQTRTVVDTYVQPNGWWGDDSRWFPYTIWTAGSWKGPVGRLTVDVQWREPQLWSLDLPVGPPDAELSDDGRRLHWQWTDVEPTQETCSGLDVCFRSSWDGGEFANRCGWDKGKDASSPRHPAKAPYLVYRDTTLAAVRPLAKTLGLRCDARGADIVLSDTAGHSFSCTVGSDRATVNGAAIHLARVPSRRRLSRHDFPLTYIPLDAVCSAFGAAYQMDRRTFTVSLSPLATPVAAADPGSGEGREIDWPRTAIAGLAVLLALGVGRLAVRTTRSGRRTIE